MAKLTEKYELMVVFNTKLGEDGIKALIERFKAYLESCTTFENVEEWGKRNLLTLLKMKLKATTF